MNHKRGRPKQARAGCLLCKRYKFGHGMENDTCGQGYRKELAAAADVRDHERDPTALTFHWGGEYGYV